VVNKKERPLITPAPPLPFPSLQKKKKIKQQTTVAENLENTWGEEEWQGEAYCKFMKS